VCSSNLFNSILGPPMQHFGTLDHTHCIVGTFHSTLLHPRPNPTPVRTDATFFSLSGRDIALVRYDGRNLLM
jgi:hypothetical protein